MKPLEDFIIPTRKFGTPCAWIENSPVDIREMGGTIKRREEKTRIGLQIELKEEY
jgi:hypothetical protein